jgi:hypothetical protein
LSISLFGTRCVEAQHEAGLAQADLGDEALKTETRIAGSTRLPEIFVDNLDSVARPTQHRSTADKTILQLRAFRVLANLACRRLSNIDIGELGAMRRRDPLGCFSTRSTATILFWLAPAPMPICSDKTRTISALR